MKPKIINCKEYKVINSEDGILIFISDDFSKEIEKPFVLNLKEPDITLSFEDNGKLDFLLKEEDLIIAFVDGEGRPTNFIEAEIKL